MDCHRTTPTQQRRAGDCSRRRITAPPLTFPRWGLGELGGGAGRFRSVGAQPRINETKALLIAVMGEIGRPVTSAELYAIWNGTKPLQVFEYHLITLVKAKVVEVVLGPELHFQLVPMPRGAASHSGSGIAGACGAEAP